MKCPRCDGTGRVTQYSEGGCSGTRSYETECDICKGIGAVKHVRTEPKKWHQCGRCSGSGNETYQEVASSYPSGKAASYRNARRTCTSCNGKGGWYLGGGDYYEPDYNARKGGCFLTTACLANCKSQDAENTLNTLRHFRDSFLLHQPHGREMIADYYALAPRIVAAIDATQDSDAIYCDLYRSLVVPCLQLIREHDQHRAMDTYISVFSELLEQFLVAPEWEQGGGI